MATQSKQRFQALLRLIDDPDPVVAVAVEKELLKARRVVIPDLEAIWEQSEDENCRFRIEMLISRILFQENYRKFRQWTKLQKPDLLEGYLLVSACHYPDLNMDRIERKIEEIRKKVWLELNNSLTSLEKITVLNHIFFEEYQFRVEQEHQFSAKYCYIHHILETFTGNPISIALIYYIIAQKLLLPVRYIDLPKNPMLAYADRTIAAKVYPAGVNTDILFYINTANRGSITGRKELEYLLSKDQTKGSPSQLEALPSRFLLLRLLETAGKSYEINSDTRRTSDIHRMIRLLSSCEKDPSKDHRA